MDQATLVEHQIDETIHIADQDALLACLETEAVAKFEQEFLKMVQKLVFEMGLTHDLAGFEAEELEDVGIANGEARC